MSDIVKPNVDGSPAQSLAMPRYLRLADNLIAVAFPLMKLLPAIALVEAAPPCSQLIESSSGTMGLALATVAAWRRIPLTLVTPRLPAEFRTQLEALGTTTVVEVDGDQRARLAALHALQKSRPRTHWMRQYESHIVPRSYAPVAADLVRLQIDGLVAPVGSGGSACGIISAIRTTRATTKLIAVDAMNSVLFGRQDGIRQTPGIGNSFVPKNFQPGLVDRVHWVSDRLMVSAARHVARELGLFWGPTGAISLLIAAWHARREPERAFAAIVPDQGHRYVSSVFSTDARASANFDAVGTIMTCLTKGAAQPEQCEDWLSDDRIGRSLDQRDSRRPESSH